MVKEWVKWKTQITQFDKRKTNMGEKKKSEQSPGTYGTLFIIR